MSQDQNSKISTEQLDDLWRESLRRRRPTGLTVASGSMAPLIEKGDRIIVMPFDQGEQARLGDIVLFDFGGLWVVHRVIGRKGRGREATYRQKGDAGYNAVSTSAGAAAGRVIKIEKSDGSTIDFEGRQLFMNGLLGRFFYALDLLRRIGERQHRVAHAGADRRRENGCQASADVVSAPRLAVARLFRRLESLAARAGTSIMKSGR